MSHKVRIKSTDVDKIKAGWGIAKGQVTRNLTNIRNSLEIEEGKFVFKEIYDNKIQEYYQNLEKAVVIYQDLHDKYIFFYKEKETDPENKKVSHEEQNIFRYDARKGYNTINRCSIKLRSLRKTLMI